LDRDYPQQAQAVFAEYVAHMRREDFRQGGSGGAPWECIGWEGQARQNPAFVPSVALPYGVLFKQR
jgi:hypothetical protein